MIKVEEPVNGFLKVTDENYELDKYVIVERFLHNLDYDYVVDYKINLTVDLPLQEATIFVYPNNESSSFLESLKNIEGIKDNMDSINGREVTYSFELLLLKGVGIE